MGNAKRACNALRRSRSLAALPYLLCVLCVHRGLLSHARSSAILHPVLSSPRPVDGQPAARDCSPTPKPGSLPQNPSQPHEGWCSETPVPSEYSGGATHRSRKPGCRAASYSRASRPRHPFLCGSTANIACNHRYHMGSRGTTPKHSGTPAEGRIPAGAQRRVR